MSAPVRNPLVKSLDSSSSVNGKSTPKHGSYLMSLASIGQLVVFGHCAFLLYAIWHLDTGTQPRSGEIWLNGLIAAVACLLQLLAFSSIRNIGKLLANGHLITAEMASAWRRLRRMLGYAGVMSMFSPEMERGAHTIGISFSWTGLFFFLVVWLCIDAITRMLEEALKLKNENEGFV